MLLILSKTVQLIFCCIMFGCKVIDHENQPPIAKKTQLLRLISIHAQVSVARLPALRCNRKCIQNDLDVHHNASQCLNRNNLYSSVAMRCDVRPNQFVRTSGCNATQAITLRSLVCILWTQLYTCTLHVSTTYMYMYCTHQLYHVIIFMYVHVIVFLLKHLAIVIVIAVAQ